MKRILIVDDSEEVVLAVESALMPLGLHIDSAALVSEAMKKAAQGNYELVVIDIMLPDGDGFELFQQLRNLPHYQNIPVIFLTSKDDIASKVSAFSLGADDYIVKPFHLLELRARVENKMKKHLERSLDGDRITSGPLTLEVSSQRVKLQGCKDFISLTPREFKILLLLVKSPNRIFSREYILDKIWGHDVYVTDRTVDAHICYLRKKLDQYSTNIESVPGEGYRFTAAVA